MIKIAHLYYDIMNLYGENGNIRALKEHFERQNIKCEIHFLTINDKIDFEKYDIYYMGMGTEKGQLLVLKDLMKYKEKIKKSIENGKYYFLTGNAYELFGKHIVDFEGNVIKCLNIFPYYTKRINKKDFMEDCDFRIVGTTSGNCSFLDKEIIGFQNRGGTIHESNKYFIKINHGVGYEPKSLYEGYLYKNFLGTYLLGPLFVRNPYLTDYFVKKIIKEKNNSYKFKIFKNTSEIKAYETFLENFIN